MGMYSSRSALHTFWYIILLYSTSDIVFLFSIDPTSALPGPGIEHTMSKSLTNALIHYAIEMTEQS